MGEGRHNVVLNIIGTNTSAYDSSVPLDWARPPFVGIPSSNEINRIDVEVPYNGCPVSGGGYNCTRACLNSSYAFSDIATLRSCVLYPSLINSYLHNLEVNDEEGLLNNHGLSVNSSELASGVSRVITNHLNGVLKEGNDCKNWYLSGDSDDFSQCVRLLCDESTSPANTDLGGIGSFTSYYLQIFILICALFVLHILSLRPWLTHFWRHTLCFRSRATHAKNDNHQASPDRSQYTALRMSTLEFQKVQCYFMLAIQIAALEALKNPGDNLERDVYNQLWHDMGLLNTVTLSGILPVVFGLYILCLFGMKSFPIFLLTIITVSLSLVTGFRDNVLIVDPDITKDSKELAGSGKYINPIRYCFRNLDPIRGFKHDHSIERSTSLYFAYSLSILFMLCLSHLPVMWKAATPERPKKWMTTTEYLRQRRWGFMNIQKFNHPRLMKLMRSETTVRVSKIAYHFAVQSIFIWMLTSHYLEIRRLSINGFERDWGLGQIISATVFIPPLVEYGYFTARGGIAKGLQYKLPPNYKLVKDRPLPDLYPSEINSSAG